MPESNTWTMFGCCSLAAASASRRKRATKASSSARCSASSFTATARSSTVSMRQEDGRHAAGAEPALEPVAARDLGGGGHQSVASRASSPGPAGPLWPLGVATRRRRRSSSGCGSGSVGVGRRLRSGSSRWGRRLGRASVSVGVVSVAWSRSGSSRASSRLLVGLQQSWRTRSAQVVDAVAERVLHVVADAVVVERRRRSSAGLRTAVADVVAVPVARARLDRVELRCSSRVRRGLRDRLARRRRRRSRRPAGTQRGGQQRLAMSRASRHWP